MLIFDELGAAASGKRYEGETEIQNFKVQFDQLSRNIWRMQRNSMLGDIEFDFVVIRDQDFFFDGCTDGIEGEYQFKKMRFIERKTKTGQLASFPFPTAATCITGNRLFSFLSILEGKITWKNNLPDYLGRPVEGVKFSNKLLQGEIHWLPNEGYLITSAKLFYNFPEQKGELHSSTKIEYQEFDGRLLPTKVSVDYENNSSVTEITELRSANPNRDFYTAESVGLKTPPRPFPYWLVWIGASLLFLVAGIYLKRKFGSAIQ